MRLTYHGKEAPMVCACGCVYASRWLVRRVRGKAGFRINTERDCPECKRTWACVRSKLDPEDWDVRSTWAMPRRGRFIAAADQSIYRAIALECEPA